MSKIAFSHIPHRNQDFVALVDRDDQRRFGRMPKVRVEECTTSIVHVVLPKYLYRREFRLSAKEARVFCEAAMLAVKAIDG